MKKLMLHLVALALTGVCLASAHAAPLAGAELAARLPGSELRGDFFLGDRFESHVWRFGPNGRVYAAYLLYPYGNVKSAGQDRNEIGNWVVESNSLCVQFPVLFLGLRNCFVIDSSRSKYVHVIGSPTFLGTLTGIE